MDQIAEDFVGWVREKQNAGDPWLIAHASIGGYVIVSNERRRGPNVSNAKTGVPNVADAYGVRCLNFNDLARDEGWIFVRTT